ncbi:MAG TPA: DUF2628 domain-containing protein [Xanthobacteraceae bacterium]|nr:DUF2628 domain-containing protein [Xanthobacteraceae bacterium]
MKIYTVHQPPERWREARRGPERFAFVRDGFHFWAFLLGPLWMLWHRLVLVLIGYLVLLVGLSVGLSAAGASSGAAFTAQLLLAILVGLEAPTLRRFTLRRRGWREVGVVSADDREAAERRFFDQWEREAGPASAPPSSLGPLPPVRRPAAPTEALGLFPEPGASR